MVVRSNRIADLVLTVLGIQTQADTTQPIVRQSHHATGTFKVLDGHVHALLSRVQVLGGKAQPRDVRVLLLCLRKCVCGLPQFLLVILRDSNLGLRTVD